MRLVLKKEKNRPDPFYLIDLINPTKLNIGSIWPALYKTALRLPEAVLGTSNQNRYCSRHQYLHPGPLTIFLSCLILSPGVAIVAQIDDSWTKIVLRLPEAILVTSNQNRYCSLCYSLSVEPLSNFQCCLVLSPGVPIVPQIDDSLTKNGHEAILVTTLEYRITVQYWISV